MLRIPNFIEMPGLLSTFTLPTTALPSYSFAISSTTGPTILQGPHHSAQKSTNTGLSDLSTNSSKFASVISKAMISIFLNIELQIYTIQIACHKCEPDILTKKLLTKGLFIHFDFSVTNMFQNWDDILEQPEHLSRLTKF